MRRVFALVIAAAACGGSASTTKATTEAPPAPSASASAHVNPLGEPAVVDFEKWAPLTEDGITITAPSSLSHTRVEKTRDDCEHDVTFSGKDAAGKTFLIAFIRDTCARGRGAGTGGVVMNLLGGPRAGGGSIELQGGASVRIDGQRRVQCFAGDESNAYAVRACATTLSSAPDFFADHDRAEFVDATVGDAKLSIPRGAVVRGTTVTIDGAILRVARWADYRALVKEAFAETPVFPSGQSTSSNDNGMDTARYTMFATVEHVAILTPRVIPTCMLKSFTCSGLVRKRNALVDAMRTLDP
jgi:hypothetical protein